MTQWGALGTRALAAWVLYKLTVKEQYNNYSAVLDSGWTMSSERVRGSNMNSPTVHMVKTTAKGRALSQFNKHI